MLTFFRVLTLSNGLTLRSSFPSVKALPCFIFPLVRGAQILLEVFLAPIVSPLPFGRLATTIGTLVSGDYSVAGLENLFAVERKSIGDLVSCCVGQNRERFERELHRLRGFRFKRLLLVGSEADILKGDYRSNIKPQAVLGTLRAFEVRYDLPVVFCQTPELAGRQVESWAFWFAREIVEAVNDLWRSGRREALNSKPIEPSLSGQAFLKLTNSSSHISRR
jgi:hypothetical protein